MFDLEEFTASMYNQGMDLCITPKQGKVTIELSLIKDKTIIGVVTSPTIEVGMARLLKSLSSSKLVLNSMVSSDKLSVL